VTPPRIGRSQRTRDKSRLLVGRRRHVHVVFVVADTISSGNSVRAPRFLVPSDCPHHSTQSDNYPFISIRASTQTYQIEQIQIKMGGNTGVALISPFEHLHAWDCFDQCRHSLIRHFVFAADPGKSKDISRT
jgi:hypothetical protein